MNVGTTLYAKNRREWRAWLAKHHKTAREIWLVYYKKDSGKPRVPYSDAVEEALCYGWIDSIMKPIDKRRYAQRFSPRKPNSRLSAMNRVRVERLKRAGRMTKAGLEAIKHAGKGTNATPPDILKRLKKDPTTWRHFARFPASYKRIRIGWIDSARARPEVFEQRLNYFLKMTKQGKRFGMVQ